MDLGYENAVAVVTGGTSGIGLATVKTLLGAGARVALCARNEGRLAQVSGVLERDFGADRILSRTVDVLDRDAVNGFAAGVQDHWGRCDLLVNNAGAGRQSTFATTEDEDWRAEYELKLFSQIYPIRAFLPMLREARGSIVAVNSLLAYQPEEHMVCTSSARAGVQNLLKSLSIEFAPDVRVNSVLMGLIESGQWTRRFEAREDQTDSRADWYGALAERKGIPLGRLGDPEEAANAIAFLGSRAASYITGAQLDVSGGLDRHI
ncbi:SDR family oxidoreductase [Maritimibacter sp. UBA3975]|uniref:SDR family oxidoreductase n=1 Tax=Maritimibacter sp. UBA3975 TaxID=1946833 RepID=UPI000C09E3DC|nr:SDR family oxidoreductase [Maritimibacter sp. UBA3975]MAM63182.1 short chain dehydrogenase [Maritimibacter sp.]|tara:strand:+ start:21170 stop:21958 length:789 start_codon:yes stop_codon:yes gene_type:complete